MLRSERVEEDVINSHLELTLLSVLSLRLNNQTLD
jgi:hypothetical protein